MATTSAQRSTILSIVNETRRKMGYSVVTTLSADRTALLYLDYLNDTVAEVADHGDTWPQLYTEVTVTASSTAITYEVNASAAIKKIHEIHIDGTNGQISPLYSRSRTDMRLLQRTSSRGVPRQFDIADTSGVNPRFNVYPAPAASLASGHTFNVGCYTQPRLYVSGDATEIPPFSSRLMVAGVMARALADESGPEQGQNVQLALADYQKKLREEFNRWTADTDDYVSFRPWRMGR
jgi:hypothetical protein